MIDHERIEVNARGGVAIGYVDGDGGICGCAVCWLDNGDDGRNRVNGPAKAVRTQIILRCGVFCADFKGVFAVNQAGISLWRIASRPNFRI